MSLPWNDTIFRVLEGSAGGDTGCGVTPDGLEQHIKSENFARYKKFNRSRAQLQMHRLAADGCLGTAMCNCDGIFSSLQNNTRGTDQQGYSEFCRRRRDSVQPTGADSQSGSPVGALLSVVGALKLGANGQGGSSGAIIRKR